MAKQAKKEKEYARDCFVNHRYNINDDKQLKKTRVFLLEETARFKRTNYQFGGHKKSKILKLTKIKRQKRGEKSEQKW